MKNSINKIIVSILTVVSIGTLFSTHTVYATTNSTDASIIEKYDSLTNQINTISKSSNDPNLLLNSSKALNQSKSLNMTILNEKEVTKIETLNEELYNLIKDNPETFGDLIISDEEKMAFMQESGISTMSTRSSATTLSSLPKWSNYGDIFMRRPTTSDGLTGHAGIGDFDKGWTIEANVASSGYEGVRYRNNYSGWKNSTYAAMYRPYGVTSSEYTAATNYAINQIGSPYNKTFTVLGDGFYCSELVYFAWKDASGLKLRTNTALGENLIMPAELGDTPLTYAISWPY